jgi:hypothetical protein
LFHTQQYPLYLYPYVPTIALLFHKQQYLPFLYRVRTDICAAGSHTAVPTISVSIRYRQLHCCFKHSSTTIFIYSRYRQLHSCFTHSSTHHIYLEYVPTITLLFLTKQYPPYLYPKRTGSCTAVSHTAIPTISIYSAYRQLHCCFTHSSTHSIYIQYLLSVALRFHIQQYPPFLFPLHTVICIAFSHTALLSISIYSMYRQLHCCYTHSSNHYIYNQCVPTVSLLFLY